MGNILAALGMVLMTFFFIFIIVIIISIVGLWKILEKCGEDGWKALVPIYGYVVLMQIVKINPLWILLCLIAPIAPFVFLFISIVVSIRLASGFGKDTGFAVGLVLLGLVFNLILGFDSSVWNPKKMDLTSFSFMNDSDVKDTGKSSTHAKSTKGTPEDPWVEGN
jgi:hypothetical protein